MTLNLRRKIVATIIGLTLGIVPSVFGDGPPIQPGSCREVIGEMGASCQANNTNARDCAACMDAQCTESCTPQSSQAWGDCIAAENTYCVY